MLQSIANKSDRSPRRGTSKWLLVALLGVEFVATPAFGQTANDADQPATDKAATVEKAVDVKPAESATPVETKPAESTAASVSTTPASASDVTEAPKVDVETEEPLSPEMQNIPGSPRPAAMGIAPEAPNVPATIGGRAPSFGGPGPTGSDWSFRLGGRISGFQSFGLGRKPDPAPPGYDGTAIHAPALTTGRGGLWAGAGLTLYMTYGNPVISANVMYYVNLNGKDYRGYYSPQSGPLAGNAFLAINPPKLGSLQLSVKVGAFTETYGGVGQWGWGIMGPALGVKGYGETITGELPLNTNYRLWFSQGFSAVPSLPENMPRGDYTGWVDLANSSFVNHVHAGINYKNNHALKLHFARINSTDERLQLVTTTTPARDGNVNVFIAEARTRQDPFGHFAVAGTLYDVKNGKNVNDGLWWGIDWTQGATTQVVKFIGDAKTGTGKYLSVSGQWDFSLARMLWNPRNFDGRHPDIRGGIAGLYHQTVETDDALYKNANGYVFGAELEYVLASWIGVFFRGYSESRDIRVFHWSTQTPNKLTREDSMERYEVHTLMPGFTLRSDWASTDAIQFAYQRRIYNGVSDPNPTAPLDRDIFTLGATASF